MENSPLRKTNAFVFFSDGEAPGAPGLVATKCVLCNHHAIGRAPICAQCFSRKVEIIAAGQRAELVEFAIVHHSAAGFIAPYAIGAIKTAENITLMAPLEGDVARFKAGMPLRFCTIGRDGGSMIGFAFTPM